MTTPETSRTAAEPDAVTEAVPTETLRQLIGGEWVAGTGEPLTDHNPSRPEEVVAEGRAAGSAELDRAYEAAHAAAEGWRRTPARERAAVLLRAAVALDTEATALGTELAREEGKTLAEAVWEVGHAAKILRFHAHEVDRATGEIYESPTPDERILVVRRPRGVIAVLTPFNFPISIPAWKLGPALVWGNTVVWKPADPVPLLAVRLAEALVDAGLPAGVLNLVLGGPELGAQLVEHRGADAVTFTGSTRVGRLIAAGLAARGVPFQGELGGKNASLVLADADLESAAGNVALGAFRGSGQMCTSTSRVIVDDAVAEEFLARLAERARAIVVGDPLDPATTMGPLVGPAACDRVQGAVTRAGAYARAVQVSPPYPDGPLAAGAFVAPAIFEVPQDDPGELWTEEWFGPVIGVRRARDTANGIAQVNDSAYGLSAAVFTADLGRAMASMTDLRVGVLHVNSASIGADLHVPFGGSRGSGLGPKEQGAAARDFVTETSTVYLRG